jgi:hypothetical protein
MKNLNLNINLTCSLISNISGGIFTSNFSRRGNKLDGVSIGLDLGD